MPTTVVERGLLAAVLSSSLIATATAIAAAPPVVQSARTAKLALLSALKTHAGSTTEPAVVQAIEALQEYNPTPRPARSADLLGEWKPINSPDYYGPIGKDPSTGEHLFTLAELSFGKFEPHDVVCRVGAICNPLRSNGKRGMMEYETCIPLRIDAPTAEVAGELVHWATCEAVEDDRLSVQFKGGSLKPAKETDLEAWKAVFEADEQEVDLSDLSEPEPVVEPEREEKPQRRGLRKRLTLWLKGKITGGKASDSEEESSLAYSVRRSPMQFLDVLYLDDELRITRDCSGNLVVAERTA